MGPAEQQLREKYPHLFSSFMPGMIPRGQGMVSLLKEEDKGLAVQYQEEIDEKKECKRQKKSNCILQKTSNISMKGMLPIGFGWHNMPSFFYINFQIAIL